MIYSRWCKQKQIPFQVRSPKIIIIFFTSHALRSTAQHKPILESFYSQTYQSYGLLRIYYEYLESREFSIGIWAAKKKQKHICLSNPCDNVTVSTCTLPICSWSKECTNLLVPTMLMLKGKMTSLFEYIWVVERDFVNSIRLRCLAVLF